jgi:hypothetical protein
VSHKPVEFCLRVLFVGYYNPYLFFFMADDLSNLWANLSLSEGEDGELEIQRTDVNGILERGQSCIVGKLLSERLVSKDTIKSKILSWWKPKKSFTFKILGGNLFLIEFEDARDKGRVLEGRPWVFEGNLFLVEDFDGHTSPAKFNFDRASFWVRMTNLPLACMGREVGLKLGASVGRVEEVDTDKDEVGWGEFLRVKINIDLYKPLSRGRMIKFDGKSTLVGFKFEHLPKFCYHCGVICHGVEGCLKRSKLRNQEIDQFGPWLRANSPTRRIEKAHVMQRPVILASMQNLILRRVQKTMAPRERRIMAGKRKRRNQGKPTPAQIFGVDKINGPGKVGADLQGQIVERIKAFPNLIPRVIREEIWWE